ncbi:MAG: right-handed parallel beta-helix repeat-containing protein [Thermoanaerobaculia bacterium]
MKKSAAVIAIPGLLLVASLAPSLLAATFTVTNTADSGPGSLRQAILDANSNPGADVINFNIAPGGVQTISPLTGFGQITGPVTINGTTQPGFAGSPIIELSGASVSGAPPPEGINIANTSPGICVVRGLVINRWPNRGILLQQNGGNIIQGNFIGTDVTGMLDMGNSAAGLAVFGLTGNLIGGTTAAERNVISGNQTNGVELHTSGHIVQGNYIGVNAVGTGPLGNSGDGVNNVNVPNSTVGGPAAGAGNLIAFNGGTGVAINGGASDTGNSIRSNSIFSNGRLGIDLSGTTFGVTPNDLGDADIGVNNLQNFPVLSSASSSGGSTDIQGTLNSTANTAFTLEFFSSVFCDPSAHGEGQTFLGSTMVTTDGSGNASFNVTLPVSVFSRHRLTATATDPSGNTSEFSACISLRANLYTLTPCRVADTRGPAGPYGNPPLSANTDRVFLLIGRCAIPTTAQAVAFNFTITQPTDAGDLRIYPAGYDLPLVSTMNYRAGQTRANNAIVPLGPAGDIAIRCVQAAGNVHFIIDVVGYLE